MGTPAPLYFRRRAAVRDRLLGADEPAGALQGREAGLWFGMSFILFFMFHTVFTLPHYALGPELTLDYNERSSLFGVRESFTVLGTIVASGAPGLSDAGLRMERATRVPSVGASSQSYWSASTGCWLARVRERPELHHARIESTGAGSAAGAAQPALPHPARELRRRKHHWRGFPATLLPFFNAYVIQPKNPVLWLSIELLGYTGVGFACLPLWVMAAKPLRQAAHLARELPDGSEPAAPLCSFLGKGDIDRAALSSSAGAGASSSALDCSWLPRCKLT